MTTTYKLSDGYTQFDLVQAARDHLFSAATLFEGDVRGLDSAGYLAHLGIELLLKALLLGATGEFPDKHSLLKLVESVKIALPGFTIPPPYPDVLPVLDRYYRLRYPDHSLPGLSQGDWPVIKEIVDALEAHLPESIRRAAHTPARDSKGGRRIIRTREDLWR